MAALVGRCLRRNVAVSSWSQSSVCCSTSTTTEVATDTVKTGNFAWHRPLWHQDPQKTVKSAPLEYRFIYPEFLPKVDPTMRNSLREKLERKDMLNRRKIVDIPEFYVGVEIMYEIYNPTIRQVEVLRLEKRLDDELFYLRDAPAKFSTFPLDLQAETRVDGADVPINPLKVKLNPRPWNARWERKELQGVEDLGLPERFYERARQVATPWLKYDLTREYRRLIPEEEQAEIYADIRANKIEVARLRNTEEGANAHR